MRTALCVLCLAAMALPAAAGPMDHEEPFALADDEAMPTVAQAMTAARGFMRSVATRRPEKISMLVAIPFVDYLGGGGKHGDDDAYCFDSERDVDEGEGLPGAPSCIATAIADLAPVLGRSIAKSGVFASLAALEKHDKKLTAPTRALLEPLAHHRFVRLRARNKRGAVRVVLAVRLAGGEPAIDAVIAELP